MTFKMFPNDAEILVLDFGTFCPARVFHPRHYRDTPASGGQEDLFKKMSENGNNNLRNWNRLQHCIPYVFMSKSFYTLRFGRLLLNVNLRKFVVFYKFMFDVTDSTVTHFGNIFAEEITTQPTANETYIPAITFNDTNDGCAGSRYCAYCSP